MIKNRKFKEFFCLQILIFIQKLLLISNSPNNEFSKQNRWDENTLFQYIKEKYISTYSNQIINLEYMVIDPNEYLKSDDIIDWTQNIELLYKEFKIISFVFIINSIKENTILSYQLRDFMYKINQEIYKYNKNYDEKKIVSILFAVESNKMFIRVGSSCRPILSDSEAMKLLKKRNNDLKSKNIKKLIYDLSNDILRTYRKNYEQNKNKTISPLKIFFYIIILVLFCYIYYHFIKINFSNNKYSENFIKLETKSEYGKKVKGFVKKNINKSIQKVMKENCLLCLENYDMKTKNNNILFDLDESSNEKILLPCNHIFHQKCISQWFLKEKSCPLCLSEFEINKEEGKININKYFLNQNWEYNNSIDFKNIIKDFLRIHKSISPDDINEDFSLEINNNYLNNINSNIQNVKVGNINFI